MKTEIKLCPICSEPIPSRKHAGKYMGSISRKDNVTEICNACGTSEALADYFPWDNSDEKAELEKAIAVEDALLVRIEKDIEHHRINGNLQLASSLDRKADLVLKTIFSLRMRLQKLQ